MVATGSPFLTRKDLLINPRKLGVVQWPYSAPIITTVKNPTTGALTLPADGVIVGSHRKQKGGALANAQTYNDIMIHGSGNPAMKIPTERRVSVGVEPVESTRQNFQNWLGSDLSGVVADASGGVHMPMTSLPQNILSRVALVGKHDYNGLDCHIVWVCNRVGVTETQEQGLTDAEVVSFPYTFDLQDVDELGGEPMFVEIFGPGWQAMQTNADAGFGVGATSILMTPNTITLDLSLAETEQLSVVSLPGNANRTAQAVYVSGTPATATVSATGLVTPVAVGTSVITATYATFTDTTNVTVVA